MCTRQYCILIKRRLPQANAIYGTYERWHTHCHKQPSCGSGSPQESPCCGIFFLRKILISAILMWYNILVATKLSWGRANFMYFNIYIYEHNIADVGISRKMRWINNFVFSILGNFVISLINFIGDWGQK